MSSTMLPKQLQHMLREANIPIDNHVTCLRERAMHQMNEYMKMVNIRISHPSHDDDDCVATLSDLIRFSFANATPLEDMPQ